MKDNSIQLGIRYAGKLYEISQDVNVDSPDRAFVQVSKALHDFRAKRWPVKEGDDQVAFLKLQLVDALDRIEVPTPAIRALHAEIEAARAVIDQLQKANHALAQAVAAVPIGVTAIAATAPVEERNEGPRLIEVD